MLLECISIKEASFSEDTLANLDSEILLLKQACCLEADICIDCREKPSSRLASPAVFRTTCLEGSSTRPLNKNTCYINTSMLWQLSYIKCSGIAINKHIYY